MMKSNNTSEFNLPESVRNRVFWGIDWFKKGTIWKNVDEIRDFFHNPGTVNAERDRRLKSLFTHVTENVPFYRHLRPSSSITDFPVVNKHIIKEQYSSFFADGIRKSSLSPVRTSGSQGVPFTVYHDERKKIRKQADLIFFNGLIGYKVGHRHALIRTKGKAIVRRWLQNEILLLADTNGRERFSGYIEILKSANLRYLIGHPSIISDIAELSLAAGIAPGDYGISGCISTSEPLTDSQRSIIGRAFGCEVTARYSSEEFGIIAHEHPVDRRYHLNNASLVIEVLALHEDTPADPGKVGRVVITDLYSCAMPLIRYDTGDLAVLSDNPSTVTGGAVFERIEGRQLEVVYSTTGSKIFPLALYDTITGELGDTDNVQKFRFAQKKRDTYELLIESIRSDKRPDTGTESLMRALKQILGRDASLDIRIVRELDQHPSGKRPFILNEYNS